MPQLNLDDLDDVFDAAGKSWDVDPMLLKAMAMQESSGNTRAVSTKGAMGLMQIIPETAKDLGVTDPYDPVQSIWGAAKYMSQALAAEGSPEGALLYYHGGPQWRQAYGDESKRYVPAIASRYAALQKQAASRQQAAPAPAPEPSQTAQR